MRSVECRSELLSHARHVSRVEGSANIQPNEVHTFAGEECAAAVDIFSQARENRLHGAIEVGDVDRVFTRLLEHVADSALPEAKNRTHPSAFDPAHEPTALGDESQRIAEAQGSSCVKRGEFTKAVPSEYDISGLALIGAERFVREGTYNEERGLGVLGL